MQSPCAAGHTKKPGPHGPGFLRPAWRRLRPAYFTRSANTRTVPPGDAALTAVAPAGKARVAFTTQLPTASAMAEPAAPSAAPAALTKVSVTVWRVAGVSLPWTRRRTFRVSYSARVKVSTSFAAAPVPAPTNAAPVAVNDSYSAAVNSTVALSVLANDTDPDGATDLAAAANVTQPIPAGATTSVAGGVVSFRATAAGS